MTRLTINHLVNPLTELTSKHLTHFTPHLLFKKKKKKSSFNNSWLIHNQRKKKKKKEAHGFIQWQYINMQT